MSGKIGGVKNLAAAITLCAAAGGWSWLLLNAIPFYLVAGINFGLAWLVGKKLREITIRKIEKIK